MDTEDLQGINGNSSFETLPKIKDITMMKIICCGAEVATTLIELKPDVDYTGVLGWRK